MNIDKNQIIFDEKELKRRLGGAEPEIARDAVMKVKEYMTPAYVIRKTDIRLYDQGVDIGFGYIDSLNLRRNLRDCIYAYAVCVTIGPGIDVLLRRSALVSAAEQFLIDASASAMVESAVDYVHDLIGGKTMARFAPGYGDFRLAYQKKMLEFTGAESIGVDLTESDLMVPTKSVTCIIGVLNDNC